MTDRDNPVTAYLTDGEKKKVKRWSDELDIAQSELVRRAVKEFTDRDRYERIEHEMGEVHDKLDRVLASLDGEHTHTSGEPKTQSVPEKARSIAQRIYRNHESPVKATNVELAIEDIGGGDDRTIETYKNQLKKRELLYEHPNSGVWTDEKEQWVSWVENAYVNPDLHDVTQEYGISTTEYTQLAEKIEQ